ncbi:FxLYD domain-containing protein [Streptomyces caeni]|uniref:FxLYD domain-containing protein n=1 Tax=Streptomyces caeni TaxID=2307231 RepID=A0ABW4IZ17_9ACTN
MARHGMRDTARGFGAVVVAAAALCGCSGDGSPSGNASQAASAAASAAASLASQASSALASATAEAGRRLDEIKGGADAKGDVRAGTTSTDADGRSAAEITVTNPTKQTRTYVVQADFRDSDGNLLDTVVVTVDDVAAGASKNATAVSHRKLFGHVTVDVARAVRY